MSIAALAAGLGLELTLSLASPSSATAAEDLRIQTVTAPLHYAAQARGEIAVRFVVASALDRDAHGDPVFVVEGLGESGVEAASGGLVRSLSALRRTHEE
jgi:hypothetical protein